MAKKAAYREADEINAYREAAGFNFGKYSSFGSTQKIDLNRIEQQIKPKDRSLIKRLLCKLLKRSGVKLGEYVDYTLKELIAMTIRYLGPLVLASVLLKYRKNLLRAEVLKAAR